MKLSITNFRGITQTVINLGKITLIAGINGAGKSSIASALAALLAGAQLPSWCKKKDAIQLINGDSISGMIGIEGEDYSVSIAYPAVNAKSIGNPPVMSEVAAGLASPLTMPDKDKAAYFARLLKTDPTLEDLTAALSDVSEKNVTMLWNDIQTNGWDSTHKKVAEKGAELKGAWMHITGEQYGTAKAGTWQPHGLIPGADIETIKTKIAELQESRDAMIANNAATTAVKAAKTEQDMEEIEKLTGIVNQKPEFEKQIKVFRDTLIDTEAEINGFHLKTVAPTKTETQPCPACNAPLMIQGNKIIKGVAINKTEQDATQKEYDRVMAKVAELESLKKTTERSIFETEQAIKVCDLKAVELAVLKDKPDVSEAEPEPVNTSAIDAEIADLQGKIDAVLMYQDALGYHEKIVKNKAIVEVLAPEGLRLTALKTGIASFNERMTAINKFSPVEMTEELEFKYNGRDYRLLSGGEQYRVRALVQMACSELDGSQYMIFDGADILDKAGRNGLIKALAAGNIPALICMTIQDREQMPELGKIGGVSYWVENGVINEAVAV